MSDELRALAKACRTRGYIDHMETREALLVAVEAHVCDSSETNKQLREQIETMAQRSVVALSELRETLTSLDAFAQASLTDDEKAPHHPTPDGSGNSQPGDWARTAIEHLRPHRAEMNELRVENKALRDMLAGHVRESLDSGFQAAADKLHAEADTLRAEVASQAEALKLAVADNGSLHDTLAAHRRENERLTRALTKIDAIRDSIIGGQTFNWSEHAYPLVAALGEAGYPGAGHKIASKNLGTLIERIKASEADNEKLRAENERLRRQKERLRHALKRLTDACVPAGNMVEWPSYSEARAAFKETES